MVDAEKAYDDDILFKLMWGLTKEQMAIIPNACKTGVSPEFLSEEDFEYFNQIETFLSSPINAALSALYEDTTSELNAKITLRREEYVEFENLLEDIYDYVVNNNQNDLKGKKKLVRILLHYMYCRCDIGKKE